MILGGSKQGYRWLNLGIQMAQNQNIIQSPKADLAVTLTDIENRIKDIFCSLDNCR